MALNERRPPGAEGSQKGSVLAWTRLSSSRPQWLHLALLYSVYVLAGGLSQGLAIVPGVSITFWPPAGLLLVSLLMSRRSSWPWWIATGALAELTCNGIWFGNTVPLALIYFAANALEAMTGAWLLQRFGPRPFRLETLRDVAIFVIYAVLLAPIVGATLIATTDAVIDKHAFERAWILVWLGDATGLLVSAPLALVALQIWRDRHLIATSHYLEALGTGALLIGVTALSFMGVGPTIYLALPPLLWISARFQLPGAAVGLAILTLVVTAFTATGTGLPAGMPDTVGQRIVTLQTFLSLAAVCALVVAAIASEHRRAHIQLRDANENLEARITERTEQLRLFIEHAPAAIAMFDANMRYLAASHRWLSDLRLKGPVVGQSHYDLFPEISNEWKLAHQRGLAGETLHSDGDWFERQEGRGQWIKWDLLPWRTQSGAVGGIIIAAEDITEHKNAQDALGAAHRTFRQLVERSPFGVYAVDGDFRLVLVSEGAQKVFENVRPLIGRDFAEVLRVIWPEPFASEAIATFRHTLTSGEPYHAPSTVERRADTNITESYDWKIERITMPDGRYGVVCHFYDLSERQAQEAKIQHLMSEVNHRAKNMLSLVQAVAKQTASVGREDFLDRFTERIQALAAGQDLLVQTDWDGADLNALIGSQLLHFKELVGDRIAVEGPPIEVTPKAAQALGMALHELATNASKYGSLSNDQGRIEITWRLVADAGGSRFVMTWRESSGPLVSAPTRRGFGQRVAKEMVEHALSGTVTLDYFRTGVVWTLSCPVNAIITAVKPPPSVKSGVGVSTPARIARGVLIVEDDAVLAMDLAQSVREAGLEVVGPAASTSEALELLKQGQPEIAILDINLGNETSESIAHRLCADGVPFIAVSGYSRSQPPPIFQQAAYFSKPLHFPLLLEEVRRTLGS